MDKLQWKEITPNIFLIWSDKEEGVVYSPVSGKLFSADGEALGIIDDYINSGKPADHLFNSVLTKYGLLEPVELPRVAEKGNFSVREVMISLSTLCNLRCIYCYANLEDQHEVTPWEVITQTIDQLFVYANGEGRVEITFHGTGESLVKWNTLVNSTSYAIANCPDGVDIDFTLVTNGSLIDSEKAKFLKKYDFFVNFSMDGLADIQNRQRPKANGKGSFNDVVKGLKNLISEGVRFTIRTTITGHNQTEMYNFFDFCANLGCKDFTMVPYSAVGRGISGVPPVNPDVFVENYILIYKRAQELGIKFSTPSDDFSKISARFCGVDGRNFAVLPDGNISACSRVTKTDDPFSSRFFIGMVNEYGVTINQEKVDLLRDINLYAFEQCNHCFARFTCSGGCPYDRFFFDEIPKEHCQIVQGILWSKLRSQVMMRN